MDRTKLGPVAADERRIYRASLGSDPEWGRPSAETADKVWLLLAESLPVPMADLLPKAKSSKSRPAEADPKSALIAKQALVVALDCAVSSGEQGKMLTFNRIFGALARRWSRRYRRARRHGAQTAYDMREDTVKVAWRELLMAGVRIDTLWKIATGPWSPGGVNPLYSISRVSGRKHARGWSITPREDTHAFGAFKAVVDADPQYRRARPVRVVCSMRTNCRPGQCNRRCARSGRTTSSPSASDRNVRCATSKARA